MDQNAYTVLITAITILGGASAWRFYEKRAMHKERDDDKDLHKSKPKQWLPGPYLFPDACSIEHITEKNYNSYITLQ